MDVIYVFGNSEYPNMCKIGYDSKWPSPSEKAKDRIRFEQARSHNPRNIIIHGIWAFDSKEKMKEVEKKIKKLLLPYRRTESHGNEWFDLSHQDAAAKIYASGIVNDKLQQTPPPQPMDREMPYDDWREPKDVYKGEVYKRLLWVFQEDSPQKRIKVIHSPLFDTCYRYAFTYNPFQVFLVAAYHHPLFPQGPTYELREGNILVESCWKQIVSDKTYGPGLMATNVGWLNEGANLDWVYAQATSCGLVPFNLLQPKPACVRPSDPQIPSIAVGDKWIKRVRQCSEDNL